MLRILETDPECIAILESLANTPVYIHVLYSDAKLHSIINEPSLIYIASIDTGDDYIIPIKQADCRNIAIPIIKFEPSMCFVHDVKQYMYHLTLNMDPSIIYDARLFMYYHENVVIDGMLETYNAFARMYPKNATCNIATLRLYEPLSKIFTAFCEIYSENPLDRYYEVFDRAINYAFYTIESAGLCIDEPQLSGFFPAHHALGNMLYSRYNFYTATGRPSNAFDGINYAALNKTSGVRKLFISRHMQSGLLLQFDYSAYHPRLISKLIKYDLSRNTDVYAHLGAYYFGLPESELTIDDVKQSKLITFTQMYGSISQKYELIPYFAAIKDYISKLWTAYETTGFVETPIFKRKLFKEYHESMNPAKLFNYIIQIYETERNAMILYRLAEYLSDKTSQMVLYTYDSILLDYHRDDTKQLLLKIAEIMEEDYFPVKITGGKNYDEMIEISVQNLTL